MNSRDFFTEYLTNIKIVTKNIQTFEKSYHLSCSRQMKMYLLLSTIHFDIRFDKINNNTC